YYRPERLVQEEHGSPQCVPPGVREPKGGRQRAVLGCEGEVRAARIEHLRLAPRRTPYAARVRQLPIPGSDHGTPACVPLPVAVVELAVPFAQLRQPA